MSQEYILERDIVYDHNERMLNIKKYYPYFKLAETSFAQFQGGRYSDLDMGYILMGIIRFFIEENSFKERNVLYKEYEEFLINLLIRDFEIEDNKNNLKDLAGYIFDKIKNEGRPFYYEYFDPSVKKKKKLRVKIIDSIIEDGMVTYFLASEAIEFYLDTKEIKDESIITVSQVLLSKMITTKNFKGGAEVIKRINNEVSKLKIRKNEVLNILSIDVFEGVKAYESFFEKGMKWFEEEQKLFTKNANLIEEALKREDNDQLHSNKDREEIYYLETELKKAIIRHKELLDVCTSLQRQVDDIVSKSKLLKFRKAFDFRENLKFIMNKNDATMLSLFVIPYLNLNKRKSFSFAELDNIFNLKLVDDEKGEKIENNEQIDFVYEDEKEDERIKNNFEFFIDILINSIKQKKELTLKEYIEKTQVAINDKITKSSDFYAFLAHLAQKSSYVFADIVRKPDTFLEEYLRVYCEKRNLLENDQENSFLGFSVLFTAEEYILDKDFVVADMIFQSISN